MKIIICILFLTCFNFYKTNAAFQINSQNSDQENITKSTISENAINRNNQQTNIPFDYAFYEGFGFYKYHKNAARWPDARDACNKEGGHLAIPDSKDELDLILKIFNMYPKSNQSELNTILLIGTTNILSPDEFRKITTGKPLTGDYVRWHPGQPSGGDGEYCGCIARDGLFHDCICHAILDFICEISL